jgi:hypothetical protein
MDNFFTGRRKNVEHWCEAGRAPPNARLRAAAPL